MAVSSLYSKGNVAPGLAAPVSMKIVVRDIGPLQHTVVIAAYDGVAEIIVRAEGAEV